MSLEQKRKSKCEKSFDAGIRTPDIWATECQCDARAIRAGMVTHYMTFISTPVKQVVRQSTNSVTLHWYSHCNMVLAKSSIYVSFDMCCTI